MYRYFIYLSFDGRAYHGWQIQPNGITVEEALDQLRAAMDEDVRQWHDEVQENRLRAQENREKLQEKLTQLRQRIDRYL